MNPQEKISDLKKNLQSVLTSDTVDFDRILDLSNQIIKLDPDKVRFSTDAGIIDRLGKELVGRQETAVSELVKNSYDADATLVELTFENFSSKGGRLTIEDNGSGMTRDELINGFMRLSSSEKIENPQSPQFKRKRAGRKGIGRFATQRLGKKLTIITQSEKSSNAYKVEIDWLKFTVNLELNSISTKITELPKQEKKGTTLIIDLLEDVWTDASIKRIYRYLIDLIQPFPLSVVETVVSDHDGVSDTPQQDLNKETNIDPGFEISIYTDSGSQKTLLANTERNIYEYALAEIEGVVQDGQGIWSVKSKRFDIDEMGPVNEKPYKFLNNVYFKAYYFIIKNVNYYPQLVASFLSDFLKERGGIRVYRNGFRVLPYGESYNDWLRLDFSYGRRYILPPFSNENFFGFIEINDPDEEFFQETSSREGLIENEPYNELVEFVFNSLKPAAFRIAEARGRKQTANQSKGWDNPKSASDTINEAIENLTKVAEDIELKKKEKISAIDFSATEIIKKTVKDLSEAKSIQDEVNAKLIEEVNMLRVLAGLGLSIATFTHEIKHNYGALLADSNQILRTARDDQKEAIERLSKHLLSFKTYSAYFDRVVSANVHRELRIQDVSEIARKFVAIMRPATERYSIILHDPIEEGYDNFSCKMHWSEWTSILLNLFTNSQKAIKRANVQGEIQIKVGKQSGRVFLEFLDNGDGISSENSERIFSPFFTTSTHGGPMADDSDELLGTGLGLKIVRDIVVSYKGEIKLIDPYGNYVTCFRIEIPEATSEEIKEYGY
jgi:signal transduction histidine kinase